MPDVGAWERFTVGPCRVDTSALPGPAPQLGGEQAQLTAGAAHFAGEPGTGQRGLGVGALHQRIPALVEQLGDAVEESGAPLGAGGAESRESLLRQRAGPLDVLGRCRAVAGVESRAGAGIDGPDLLTRTDDGFSSDDHGAGGAGRGRADTGVSLHFDSSVASGGGGGRGGTRRRDDTGQQLTLGFVEVGQRRPYRTCGMSGQIHAGLDDAHRVARLTVADRGVGQHDLVEQPAHLRTVPARTAP